MTDNDRLQSPSERDSPILDHKDYHAPSIFTDVYPLGREAQVLLALG
jgi:hypothetical protein